MKSSTLTGTVKSQHKYTRVIINLRCHGFESLNHKNLQKKVTYVQEAGRGSRLRWVTTSCGINQDMPQQRLS